MRTIKLLLTMLCVLSAFFLLSCSEEPYEFDQNIDQICKIEIINVQDGNNVESYAVILEINSDQHQKFLADYLEMGWEPLHPPGTPPHGLCIKFTYSNGEYEIVYDEGYYKSEFDVYNAHSHIDYNTWQTFLERYGIQWEREYGIETWSYID